MTCSRPTAFTLAWASGRALISNPAVKIRLPWKPQIAWTKIIPNCFQINCRKSRQVWWRYFNIKKKKVFDVQRRHFLPSAPSLPLSLLLPDRIGPTNKEAHFNRSDMEKYFFAKKNVTLTRLRTKQVWPSPICKSFSNDPTPSEAPGHRPPIKNVKKRTFPEQKIE